MEETRNKVTKQKVPKDKGKKWYEYIQIQMARPQRYMIHCCLIISYVFYFIVCFIT